LTEAIELTLDAKFKAEGLELLPQVAVIRDLAKLRKLCRFLHKAKTVDQVREFLK